MRLVSTTFMHPDRRWGNHLRKAHLVGVYTLITYCTGSLIGVIVDSIKHSYLTWPLTICFDCSMCRSCIQVKVLFCAVMEAYIKVSKHSKHGEPLSMWFTSLHHITLSLLLPAHFQLSVRIVQPTFVFCFFRVNITQQHNTAILYVWTDHHHHQIYRIYVVNVC